MTAGEVSFRLGEHDGAAGGQYLKRLFVFLVADKIGFAAVFFVSFVVKRMRVIAGKFRSRPLRSLHGLDIRPTSDRLRETLFDVLTAGNPEALAGSVWLDLFAGTGAVGIEALSRGAAKVYFVESSRHAAELIRTNLHSLGITDGFQVLHDKALHAMNKLEELGIKPSFIFLDPPYRMREVYAEALARLNESSLGQEALIIAEHEKRFEPGQDFGILRRLRKLDQGDAALSFYKASQ